MFLRRILLTAIICLTSGQNSTDDLEVRVTLLENDVSVLQDELEEVETDNTLQDERLNTMEESVAGNGNDIDDLEASADETEDTIVLLQQSISALEDMNSLLLERVDVLEAALEASNQHINELENVVNTTAETIEDLEADVQDTNERLVTVEESDSDQNDRMTIIENEVDQWDDRIVVLEVENVDIQERLSALEEAATVPWVSCSSFPCTNGGTCIDVNVDTFVCMCRDGFYGETCQYTPVEACSSSPCQNGGTCVDVNVDTFICACRDGYFGNTCGESYGDTSFLASIDHDPGSPPNPIVFNVEQINPGGYYDSSNGKYTVPVNGIYEFMVHIWAVDDYTFGAYLEVDETVVAFGYAHDAYEGETEDPYLDMSILLSLTAGDQVWLSPWDLSGMQGDDGNGMSTVRIQT